MNFEALARSLLAQSRTLVSDWLPGGRINGREYVCGSISGGPGDSFRVNLQTGKWAEFSGDLKGGDLISLYAAVKGITNGEAYKQLGGETNLTMLHPKHGAPSASWTYYSRSGQPIMVVARYETAKGKEFLPWSKQGETWRCKGLPEPRPLYGLELLDASPDAPVLIVEGEKAAEAARTLAPQFVVLTWPNGAQAWKKTDFSPIYGRKIVLWPDADKPGRGAMEGIATLLTPKCPAVKVLDPKDKPSGWDAADAIQDGLTQPVIYQWIKETSVYTAQVNITVTADEPPPTPSQYATIEKLGLAVNEKGAPFCELSNVALFLERSDYAGTIWFDQFHQRIFTQGREWTDFDTLQLTDYLQKNVGMRRLSDEIVYKAVSLYAQQNAKNEPRDWMDSLVWDQKPRIATFFIDYMGAEESAYTFAVGHNFWVSMAARIYRPGCQMDHMVVLEGPQNAGKTSALRLIGGAWYAEAGESVQSKDFFLVLAGRLLVEIAELDAFNKAEVNRIKQVISCPVDRYRAPYGRSTGDHPRTSIFVGTTNDESYLRDATGARRFWPIRCGVIDLPGIKLAREQLFAEAVTLFKKGNPWHLTPDFETKEIQESRRDRDAWEDILGDKLGMFDRISINEAADMVKVTVDKLDMRTQRRLGNVLRKLGFSKTILRNQGVLQKTWTRTVRVTG